MQKKKIMYILIYYISTLLVVLYPVCFPLKCSEMTKVIQILAGWFILLGPYYIVQI